MQQGLAVHPPAALGVHASFPSASAPELPRVHPHTHTQLLRAANLPPPAATHHQYAIHCIHCRAACMMICLTGKAAHHACKVRMAADEGACSAERQQGSKPHQQQRRHTPSAPGPKARRPPARHTRPPPGRLAACCRSATCGGRLALLVQLPHARGSELRHCPTRARRPRAPSPPPSAC